MLFKKISDIKIIEGVRNQDDKILNWLYDNYLQIVKKYVLKNNGSDEDVSDVFQETIIALYKQITDGNLNLTSTLENYFFGIARNIWGAQLRANKRNTTLEFDISNEEDNIDGDEIIFERIVSRAFEKLKPDQQIILNLFSEGISYKDIALKMNFKNETYARRKKYLCKEALVELIKEDSEYQEYLRFRK